jgi:EAL domain-containing protein (putative c-di-GMP-specific phosphodiesterase class I)
MPGAFLAAHGDQRLIVPLGDWILRQGGCGLRRWQGAGLGAGTRRRQHLRRAIAAPRVADHLHDLVGEWRNEKLGIDIEITEGVLIDDVSSAVSQLRVLRRSGIRVAIDDLRHRLLLAEPAGQTFPVTC